MNTSEAAPRAGWVTPLLSVADVERSIAFYTLLGFEVVDTDRCEPIGWARLHVRGGAIMLNRADEPVDPAAQAVLLYLYTPDLIALRDHVRRAGITTPPIRRPHYMQSGELHLHDPDGYTVLVGHWGEAEDVAWRERIGRDEPRG